MAFLQGYCLATKYFHYALELFRGMGYHFTLLVKQLGCVHCVYGGKMNYGVVLTHKDTY